MIDVALLTPQGFGQATGRLGEILADAVNTGAGVSFMLPFTAADAKVYWRDQLPAVETGRKLVFVACEAGVIAGTVTLDMAWAPNQPHRGDISKMLVHSAFRRRGVGRLLLSALECEARHRGLTLLTFDTVSDSPADLFYRSLGYQFVGRIPGYAMSPSGRMDDTSIFYKTL